jgi:hypothetical protein
LLLVVVGTGLLSVHSGSAEAQMPGLYVGGGITQASPSGTESIIPTPGSGQPVVVNGIDVKETLGFSDRASYFFEARYQFERWRIEASYREAHFSGTWNVAPTPLAVEVDWSVLSFGVRGDFLSKPVYALGVELDVDQVRHDAYSAPASSSGTPLWNREDTSSPTKAIPFVTATLRSPDGRLWLDLKAGMSLFDGGSPTRKARVEAGWLITEGFGLKGGWDSFRYQKAEGSGSTARAVDLRVAGLNAGILLRF